MKELRNIVSRLRFTIIMAFILMAVLAGLSPLNSQESPVPSGYVAFSTVTKGPPPSSSLKVKITSDESGTLRFYNVNGYAISFVNGEGKLVTSQRLRAQTPEVCTVRKGATYKICFLVREGLFSKRKAEFMLSTTQFKTGDPLHLSPMTTFRWTVLLLPIALGAGITLGSNMAKRAKERAALPHQEPEDGESAKKTVKKVRKAGDTIRHYTIVDEIGHGRMATTYRVKNNKGGLFVLKLLHPELFDDLTFRIRIQREVSTLMGLYHPGIVRMYGSWMKEREEFYLCYEYIEGQSLRTFLQKNPLPSQEATVGMIIDSAAALGFAHSKGIVHRDVRPENIMLTRKNAVRLTDFGLARDFDLKTLTDSDAVPGKGCYLSPEQADSGRVDSQSDLYALGVIFYEMLAGRPPFQDEDALKTVRMHVCSEPCSPRCHNESIPDEIDAVVMKLLRKDPRERFNTAEEMIGLLRKYR